jgi:hypothetical protein
MKKAITIALFILSITACVDKQQQSKKTVQAIKEIADLPKVQNIDSLKTTDFVPTMESYLQEGKNIIYCPTLLFAWQGITKITGPLKVQEDKDSRDILQLNQSTTYKNALDSNEYKTTIEVAGNQIKSTAEFNTELTFKPLLEKMDYPLTFKQKEMQGFGMINWNQEIASLVNILYFKDNDNFAFSLTPEQADNEIIFMMGTAFNKAKSFADVNEKLLALSKEAAIEKKQNLNSWKYKLIHGETFAIPNLTFNLEKSFENIVGKKLYNLHDTYLVKVAKQRNALLLNNKGAKIESKAEIVVEACTEAAEMPSQEIIEKHLFLNKTFYIIFKHKSKANPYMFIKVDSDELMEKYKK